MTQKLVQTKINASRRISSAKSTQFSISNRFPKFQQQAIEFPNPKHSNSNATPCKSISNFQQHAIQSQLSFTMQFKKFENSTTELTQCYRAGLPYFFSNFHGSYLTQFLSKLHGVLSYRFFFTRRN